MLTLLTERGFPDFLKGIAEDFLDSDISSLYSDLLSSAVAPSIASLKISLVFGEEASTLSTVLFNVLEWGYKIRIIKNCTRKNNEAYAFNKTPRLYRLF